MNTLANAIQNEGLTGKPDEIAAALAETVYVRPANTKWSYKGLAQKFGREAVGMIDETLKVVPGIDWVRLSLASADGLDFADAETQALPSVFSRLFNRASVKLQPSRSTSRTDRRESVPAAMFSTVRT
jgi:hypothetical protein